MLEMGFAEVMASITSHLPKNRQTILLSATFPDDIKNISRSLQEKPIQITVDAEVSHDEVIIEQLFFEVQRHERDKTLLALLVVPVSWRSRSCQGVPWGPVGRW